MKVLVINCGSSSLKFQLIDPVTEEVAAKGLCERIGINGSMISYTPAGGSKIKKEVPMENHTDAIRLVIDALTNEETGDKLTVGEMTDYEYCIQQTYTGSAENIQAVADAYIRLLKEKYDLLNTFSYTASE